MSSLVWHLLKSWSCQHSSIYLLIYLFGCTAWVAGSQSHNQGLNLGSWQWKPRILTTRPSENSHDSFHLAQCSQGPSMLLQNAIEVKATQSCLTLCDHVDYTAQEFSRPLLLEWVAIPISRGSSQPRNQTQVSHTAGRFSNSWGTREALMQGILF